MQELQSKEIEVMHAGRNFEGDAAMNSQDSEDNEVAFITMSHNDEGIKHILWKLLISTPKTKTQWTLVSPSMDIIISISDTMNMVGNAMWKHKKNLPLREWHVNMKIYSRLW
jgi:hypothetical protein